MFFLNSILGVYILVMNLCDYKMYISVLSLWLVFLFSVLHLDKHII